MAPKNKFTKQRLIYYTIREIADRLGCSIAPIYVIFAKNILYFMMSWNLKKTSIIITKGKLALLLLHR